MNVEQVHLKASLYLQYNSVNMLNLMTGKTILEIIEQEHKVRLVHKALQESKEHKALQELRNS